MVEESAILSRVDPIEILKNDVWSRWRSQFGRVPAPPVPGQAERVIYARSSLFDLKDYVPPKFKPGGRSSSQPFPGLDNRVYHLDAQGRPVHVAFRHSYNKVDWQGIYRYMPDEAEFCEWCVQTGVPSHYDRVTIRDGQPASFQRLRVNGGGSFPNWRGRAPRKVIGEIASNPYYYEVWVEHYDVQEGRIRSGISYVEGMGRPPTRSNLVYSYSNGRLDRIVYQLESGEQQTVYAARQPTSFTQLSADLSRRIAERTIDLVRGATLGSPLVALELPYTSVESYVPGIIPWTEKDVVSEVGLCLAIPSSRWLDMPAEDLAPAMTDFHQRVRSTGKYDAGTRMLREAARQVTEQAGTQLRTVEGFVAYPIDWEMEGDDLERILRECGATPESLKRFRGLGWI